MRIMLDTDVLLSALLFPSEQVDGMMRCVFEEHRLVLPTSVVEELSLAVKHRFPEKTPVIDRLLSSVSCEFVYIPPVTDPRPLAAEGPSPVLRAAARENVDVVITNRPDPRRGPAERPEVLTPAEFLRRFVIR